jgi:poly(A) polymerase
MAEHDTQHRLTPPSLKEADWLERRQTQAIFDALDADGIETRAVGGAVRNALLGIPVHEVDLATTAEPDKVLELARAAKLKAVPTGIDHGTVTLITDGMPFEVTTLRRDVETFGRHATVAFTKDWEEDAKRRDFTLNALYADRDGTVFDPLGGYADLAAGRVRFIGDAAARIEEDHLRILRFFRFSATYAKGAFDAEGLHACVRKIAGLSQLSAERVGAEMRRILVARRALDAIVAMFDYGLLTEVLGSVPRLDDFARLVAIENMAKLGDNPARRLAVLAVFVEEDAARLAARLRLSNAEQSVLVLGGERSSTTGLPEEANAKALLYRRGEGIYPSFVLIAWARSGAAPSDAAWRAALELPQTWRAPVFPLRGTDMTELGLEGPDIGEALRRLETEWIAGDFKAEREALLARAKTLKTA